MDAIPKVTAPIFAPFKKLRVVLALEATPAPIDEKTDITTFAPIAFKTGQQGDGGVLETEGGAAVALQEPGVEPLMFGKRKRVKKSVIADAAAEPTTTQLPGALPDFLLRTKAIAEKKKTKRAEGAPNLYARVDAFPRELQAEEIKKLSEELQVKAKVLLDVETQNPYSVEPPAETFVPMSRRGFGSFIINEYGSIFPKRAGAKPDVATCAAKGEEGSKEVKIYHYQEFIREYLRYETPYRGLLVYHGLGSGKTCSAIAAAEALFGTRGAKIIVMTPSSLRSNFISEINFCGFKHFRLQNHWMPLSLLPGATPEPQMVRMFAQNVYGMPDSFFGRRSKGRSQLTRIWIPDFDAPANFDSLSPEEKDEIQTQLKVTIENRIKFINYNGILARELKEMICTTPDVFDNSVIVIDEIHNVIRLIQGTLERPFTKGNPVETLTADRTPLPNCGKDEAYQRGYLFYRLLMGAKNCKIIGLSGTPLINFPEELGILMNILHGALHTIEFIVAAEGMRDIKEEVKRIVGADENLDTVFFMDSEGSINVTVTRLPEQFVKIFEAASGDAGSGSESSDNILGIKRRDPLQPVPTLQQVWDTLSASLKTSKIVVKGVPSLKAQELLPSWDTMFRAAFLQEDGITLKNVPVLQKRIRGLISYYRGIQGNVMPKVIKDEIVGIPLKGYSLKIYNKLRNQEIQVEMSKPKGQAVAVDDVWGEIKELASMKTPSNYRMSSRQACNFVFPEGITRPRPKNLEEQDVETGKDRDVIVDGDMEGKVAGRDDEATSISDEETGEGGATILGKKEAAELYRRAVRAAKDKLREMGPTHLMIDGPSEHNLEKYSPKFLAMLNNINALSGSSLVYSTFLEMEGIGIFGICMEANGYVPIEIVTGADGKLKFSDRSAESLKKGPKVKENRYIEFTGAGSKEQRGAAVNVFNARLDKLSPAMEKVLKDGGWDNNWDGGLCRVFCITSAGAEGLSLKAVRGVHIMEPYWNTVRTQQVKGRAVRICSHMDLPPDQQNVSIYTYCTTVPEEAIIAQAIDKTLERTDIFSARQAALLGVPVPERPKKGEAVPEGLFFKVDEKPEEPVPEGAQATLVGPVKFAAKLANEYRGFSNLAPSPIVIDGKRYPTVEHYFHAMKFPGDIEWQEAIRVAPDAIKARQLAADASHSQALRADWETVQESVLLDALRAKFQQNRGLLELLKSTGSRPLVEDTVDAYWGVGRTGKGKNRMGKLLEQVREELKEYVIPEAVQDQAPLTQVDFTIGQDFSENEEEVAPAMPEASARPDELMPIEVQKGGAGEEDGVIGDDSDHDIILTSDQKVLLISLRKEKVMTALQTLMKSVSVDCKLNYDDNNDGTYKCLNLGESIGSFAYHPNLQKDIAETEAAFRAKAVATEATMLELPTVAAAAVPVALPVPSRPVLKKLEYRKKGYRYTVKMNPATKLPFGYILFDVEDLHGDKVIGYITATAKGLPSGDVLTEPPTWAV